MRLRPRRPDGSPIGHRCEYKRHFKSKKRALQAAHGLRRATGSDVEAYKCLECKQWTVGHRRGSWTDPTDPRVLP